MSPELRSDIEELNRRRADIAVGWATVEALRRAPAGLGNLGPLIGDLAALAAAKGIVPAPAD